MFNIGIDAPQTSRYPAIIECLTAPNDAEASFFRIFHRAGTLKAWSWLSTLRVDRPMTGEVTTMEIQCKETDETEFILLDFKPAPEMPIAEAFDDPECAVPGLVQQVSDLIEGLHNRALYRLVREALLQPEALLLFWNRPSTMSGHYSYPGGLAARALEVASMAAVAAVINGASSDDRDIAVVHSLLCDYREIWGGGVHAEQEGICVQTRNGFEGLSPALNRLMAADPYVAEKLIELLNAP